jgi:hypothetical protein
VQLKASIIILASLINAVMFISCGSEENKNNPSLKIEDTITGMAPDDGELPDIIIGGRNYNKWRSSIFNSVIPHLTIFLDPNNPDASKNFDGIEELQILKDIIIAGDNFDTVDFSPLGKLKNILRCSLSTFLYFLLYEFPSDRKIFIINPP